MLLPSKHAFLASRAASTASVLTPGGGFGDAKPMLTGFSRAPILAWLREQARLSFLFSFRPGRIRTWQETSGGTIHEADLSAQASAPEAQPRVFCADVQPGRPRSPGASPSEGAQASFRLALASDRLEDPHETQGLRSGLSSGAVGCSTAPGSVLPQAPTARGPCRVLCQQEAGLGGGSQPRPTSIARGLSPEPGEACDAMGRDTAGPSCGLGCVVPGPGEGVSQSGGTGQPDSGGRHPGLFSRGAVLLITMYQAVSRYTPAVCRFTPTCSEYARQAILRHGFFRGGWMAACRLGRCHPFHPGGHDPVP